MKTQYILFIIAALAVFLFMRFFLFETVSGDEHSITPKQAYEMIEANSGRNDFTIIDVRTTQEYRAERISGARLINYHSPSFKEELSQLPKDATYLLYCRSGNRSGSAASVMKELGFQSFYHIAGGITAWKAEGYPVEN